jgi:hypothetical protein
MNHVKLFYEKNLVKNNKKKKIKLHCRCLVEQCGDQNESSPFLPSWWTEAIPSETDGSPSSCLTYAPANVTTTTVVFHLTSPTPLNTCAEHFDNSSMQRCDEWVYDGRERTILTEVWHNGCVRLLLRTIFIWYTDRSLIIKQFEPFQYYFVDPLLDSSTASHVKNGPVLNKRLRSGPTIERSDPSYTNKRMLLVPVQTGPYQWTHQI